MEMTIANRHKDEIQISWQESVATNQQQISAYNTFREALFQRLSSTISGAFTLLLSHADRNSNVSSYFKYVIELSKIPFFCTFFSCFFTPFFCSP